MIVTVIMVISTFAFGFDLNKQVEAYRNASDTTQLEELLNADINTAHFFLKSKDKRKIREGAVILCNIYLYSKRDEMLAYISNNASDLLGKSLESCIIDNNYGNAMDVLSFCAYEYLNAGDLPLAYNILSRHLSDFEYFPSSYEKILLQMISIKKLEGDTDTLNELRKLYFDSFFCNPAI